MVVFEKLVLLMSHKQNPPFFFMVGAQKVNPTLSKEIHNGGFGVRFLGFEVGFKN
jgi:hypothetical protein